MRTEEAIKLLGDAVLDLVKVEESLCKEINKISQEIIKLNERIEDATTSPRRGEK